jgi:hypothetical protein
MAVDYPDVTIVIKVNMHMHMDQFNVKNVTKVLHKINVDNHNARKQQYMNTRLQNIVT